MRLKNSYFYTLREDVKDEDSLSGNLLVKAGFIKKTSAGIYMMLPLGLKVQNKIEAIIRKNMDATGAQEVRMPALIAADYYEKSGRLANFGHSIFRLKDRGGKEMTLGPTHEELFAVAAKMMIRSYKNLPFNLYQFQTKFRDEPRARFGLIRVKEFVMKDAYSFDVDEKGLDIAYQKMFEAYQKSFDEIGVNYRIVQADTGVMGGLLSEEFQAITPIGEDTIVYCDHCGYTSNREIAQVKLEDQATTLELREKELVYTPHAGTIAEVCRFLNLPANKFVKTLIYRCDERYYAVLVRGDKEVAVNKLAKLVKADEVELAEPKTVEELTGAKVGFAGPIGIKCPIIMDNEVSIMHNYIVGACQSDYHYINVNQTDFQAAMIADVRLITAADHCPICGADLHFTNGIEVGNTFKLGTKYAEALDLTYLNRNNQSEFVWMGSYGIGIGRTMAALVEQNHDEHGIIWPLKVAPYSVALVLITSKDELQVQKAEELYDALTKAGIDVLFDDRDERAGVKFKDLDLIGIPYRLTIGKKIHDNKVEFKERTATTSLDLDFNEIIPYLKKLL